MAPNYRTADVDGFKVFYREPAAPGTETSAAARLPECRSYVPRPDPAARRQVSHRGTGPARLRAVRHARARSVPLQLRQTSHT